MRLVTVLTCLACLLPLKPSAFGQEKTWDGECGNNFWDCGDNWDPDGAPSATDNVTLQPVDPTVEIRVGVAAEANQVTIASGLEVSGANPVTFHGASQIANLVAGQSSTARLFTDATLIMSGDSLISGLMDGSGTYANVESMSVGGTLFTTLENHDMMSILTQDLTLDGGAVLKNFGTVELTPPGDIKKGFSGINTLENSGTLRKLNAGFPNTSVISTVFTQTGGTIEVQDGFLNIEGPFSLTGGSASIAADGILRFSGNPGPMREFAGIGEFTGEGKVLLDTLIRIRNETGCSLVGGMFLSADLTLDSFFTNTGNLFVGGTIGGSGTLENLASGMMKLDGAAQFAADVLNLGTFDQDRPITIGPGTFFHESGGTWTIRLQSIVLSEGGKIVNSGSIRFEDFEFFEEVTSIRVPLDMVGSATLVVGRNHSVLLRAGGEWAGGSITLEENDSGLSCFDAPIRVMGAVDISGEGEFGIFGTGDAPTLIIESGELSVCVESELSDGIILGPGVLRNNADMNLNGATIGAGASVVNAENLRFVLPLSILGTLTNLGTVASSNGTLTLDGSGRILNRRRYQAGASITGTNPGAVFENSGTFVSSAVPGLIEVDCAFDNTGVVLAQETSILFRSAETNVVQISDGMLSGGTWEADGTGGKIIFEGVTIDTLDEETFVTGDEVTLPLLKDLRNNKGEFKIIGLVTLDHGDGFSNDGEINTEGKFDLNGGCLIQDSVTDDLAGIVVLAALGGDVCQDQGYFTPLLLSHGQVTPGGHGAAGGFCLTGDYDQQATGILNIELDGLTPIAGHDQLIVNGNVSLSGSIRVVPIGTFQPQPGDEFVVIQAANGSVTGTFDDVIGPAGVNLVYAADSVTVIITSVPGDADTDGDLDLDDYAGLFACVSGPGASANPGCGPFDFDADGDVDNLDYRAFQLRFTGPND